MDSIQLAAIDWVIVAVYLLAVATIGVFASMRVKDSEQYFLGKRSFNKWLMIGQSFGTGTHAEMPVSLAGAVYTIGASGIWYQWKNLFATPFFWLLAPMFRRMRRTTMGEVVEDRYGPWVGAVYSIFALCFFTINTASMLKGAAKVISQATGGHAAVNQIVIGMTVVFIFYSFIGGLVATAWSDFLQGILIIVLSFMLIPLGLEAVGGIAVMKQTLDPYKFSLATPRGIGPWFIVMLTLNGLIGIVAQPHIMAVVGTGKDERACRVGFLCGMLMKRFCTIGWVMVGLIVSTMTARAIYGVRSLGDPEDAFGFACRRLLFPGGVGLLIASVLAANMAGCSAFMVNSGALFTQNFYRKYLVRSESDRHYLNIGRISGLLVAVLGVCYAVLFIQRVLYSFLLTETMATFVGISILGGIVWPRANRWGAMASLLVSIAVNFTTYYLRAERLDNWDPNVFFAATVAGIMALVFVSLLTNPEPDGALRGFYRNLQTPAVKEEEVGSANCPVNYPRARTAAIGQQLLVLNVLHLRRGAASYGILRAYREDLSGLLVGCGLALGMVLIAWLLF